MRPVQVVAPPFWCEAQLTYTSVDDEDFGSLGLFSFFCFSKLERVVLFISRRLLTQINDFLFFWHGEKKR